MSTVPAPVTADPHEQVRTRILDAAEARFRRYGYRKTTMAEIAHDVGMSAANLYRYFDNKQDIGAGLARRCLEEKEALLREVARRPGLNAAARLEELAVTLARYTHDQCHDQPRLSELVEDLGHRPDIVARKQDGERALIAELLSDGQRRGEFRIDDVTATAETTRTALLRFSLPLFMEGYPREALEQLARRVARLLIRGLT